MDKKIYSPVENLSAYLHAKFEAHTAITQKLVLFYLPHKFLLTTITNFSK